MKPEDVVQEFKDKGALLEGHFQLSSGLHSTVYLQCALVLQYPEIAERFGQAIGRHFEGQNIQLVASPAIGGIIIGHEVARALGARFLWTERENGAMRLRRGFTVSNGEKTLVVEDVITTGGSTRDVVEILQARGVKVVAAGSIIDRSGGQADVTVPRTALATLQVAAHYPEQCPMCQLGIPAIKPGSRPA